AACRRALARRRRPAQRRPVHDAVALLGITRIGGIACRLQLLHVALRVIRRLQRPAVARVALDEAGIVLEAVFQRTVGTETRHFLGGYAVAVLQRRNLDVVTVPAVGLDAKQVVAGAAVGTADDMLAPAR